MAELGALKYDKGLEKLPWDLLPVESVEGMLRVLLYGKRKYSTCGDCGAKIYPNPRLDGDPPRDDCPKCKSKNIASGAHNWRKGFEWARLIAASFRHLKSILQSEDTDPESGLPHVDHLMCMVAFLSGHQKCGYGMDDRYKPSQPKQEESLPDASLPLWRCKCGHDWPLSFSQCSWCKEKLELVNMLPTEKK